MTTATRIHSHIPPQAKFKQLVFDAAVPQALDDLRQLGIYIDARTVSQMRQASVSGFAQDAIQPTVTTGSIPTPVQFLQEWLPGFVFVITAARNIDMLAGLTIAGAWHDEQMVQGVLERTGAALPYGDYTNTPYASWNVNFETRTVVRFEEGMMVDILEEARSSEIRVDTAATKRMAAAMQLEIQRNRVGFYGFNNGANNTYGYLNDPGLPSYVTVANGVAGTPQWSTKTFLEIQKDILTAIQALRNKSQDNIDPSRVDLILAVATGSRDFLGKTSEFGISVMAWLKDAYPRIQVMSAPELNSANGGANVFYLYAVNVLDDSSDDGRVIEQYVQAKYKVNGVQPMAKGYIESYSNATAGVMCKRPWGLVRYSGI